MFLLQGIDPGWYSLIMGIIIMVVIFGCIGACVLAGYYYSKRQDRRPKSERSTFYQALNIWAMLIQVYVFFVAIIAGALYFFLPHLFVPELAFPVVGAILSGVVIIFVISYYLAWKGKGASLISEATPEPKKPRPTSCPVCGNKLNPEDQFCSNCGATIE